jgi:inner membrane transporter RhtA
VTRLRAAYDRRVIAERAPESSLLGRVPSPALVLGAFVSLQLGSSLAVKLFSRVGPAGVVTLRLVAGALLVGAIARPRLRATPGRALLTACALGLILLGMNLCFYESIDRIPLGIAVAIEFLGPLSVAVFGSRRPHDLVWAALALAGVIAMTHGNAHVSAAGVGFALSAGVLWAAYILVTPRVAGSFSGTDGLAVALGLGALVALPIGIASEGSALADSHVLLVGALIGLLASAVPYAFEMEALRRIRPAVFGVLMSLEPGVAALMGFVVLGQQLGARPLVGLVLVCCASLGAALTDARRAQLQL